MIVKGLLQEIVEPFRPGDRIRFSELGKQRMWRSKVQTGVIVRQNREGSSYIVLLDSRKTEATIHHSYIEKDDGHVFG